ncbi:MAG: hypothetical protein K2M55_07475 [Muribaculaceae bacterium]|nr:hypothetical protein [Muribaculaceae bacterium]
MKRKLLQQMRNEWRSNIWMCVELVITGLVLWGIFSTFIFLDRLHQEPEGYDISDIYVGYTGCVSRDAATYKPYADSLHNRFTDLETLLANLSNNPYVESLGAGNNALPYTWNYSGNMFAADINGTRQTYTGNLRHMTPELVRTLRMTGVSGETTEQLAEMIENGQTILSLHDGAKDENDPMEWRGRDAFWTYDSTRVEHIGAIIKGIRRNDYEPIFNGMILQKLPASWFPEHVAIRVKPGKGSDFMASLKSEDLEFGNVYLSTVTDIKDLRDRAQMNVSNDLSTLTVSTLFILAAVFLGFLGTFWFRTQQRVPELALRRVNGATRRDLFRRLLGEGMLMLAGTLPFIAAIGALILYKVDLSDVIGSGVTSAIGWSGLPCAAAALALMITAGLTYPALKAMKVNPAEALKDQ